MKKRRANYLEEQENYLEEDIIIKKKSRMSDFGVKFQKKDSIKISVASSSRDSKKSIISVASSSDSSHFFGKGKNNMKAGRLRRKNMKVMSGLY